MIRVTTGDLPHRAWQLRIGNAVAWASFLAVIALRRGLHARTLIATTLRRYLSNTLNIFVSDATMNFTNIES